MGGHKTSVPELLSFLKARVTTLMSFHVPELMDYGFWVLCVVRQALPIPHVRMTKVLTALHRRWSGERISCSATHVADRAETFSEH